MASRQWAQNRSSRVRNASSKWARAASHSPRREHSCSEQEVVEGVGRPRLRGLLAHSPAGRRASPSRSWQEALRRWRAGDDRRRLAARSSSRPASSACPRGRLARQGAGDGVGEDDQHQGAARLDLGPFLLRRTTPAGAKRASGRPPGPSPEPRSVAGPGWPRGGRARDGAGSEPGGGQRHARGRPGARTGRPGGAPRARLRGTALRLGPGRRVAGEGPWALHRGVAVAEQGQVAEAARNSASFFRSLARAARLVEPGFDRPPARPGRGGRCRRGAARPPARPAGS